MRIEDSRVDYSPDSNADSYPARGRLAGARACGFFVREPLHGALNWLPKACYDDARRLPGSNADSYPGDE